MKLPAGTIDALLHLLDPPDLAGERGLDPARLDGQLRALEARLRERGLRGAHLSLLDEGLLASGPAVEALRQARGRGFLRISCCIDLARPARALDRAVAAGLWGVKIHTYLQEVGPDRRDRAVAAGLAAARRGLVPVVCGAFGTDHLEERFGLPVAIGIARRAQTPVLLAHGGGARVKEAFLAAQTLENLVLDLSFSPWYWRGSTVEQDFRWVVPRLGPGRVVFGTDSPYVPWAEAYAYFDGLLEACGAEARRHEILCQTPARLFGFESCGAAGPGDPVLRPARAQDRDLLLAWRNDPGVVAASGTGRRVTLAQHRAWLAGVLADPARRLWIAEAPPGTPVGQLRLDPVRGRRATYEVTISVEPGSRGGGIGRGILAAGLDALAREVPGASVLARVRPGNDASRRLFAAAGFRPRGVDGDGLLMMGRRVARPAGAAGPSGED